nr:glucosamine 6-phosphate N-acetyltransferase [Tanacetum cinerariifolium]
MLEINDKNKGFMELLQQLTVCDPVSDQVFQKRFEEFTSYGGDHIICVIEDMSGSKIVAAGSVLIEKKFVRSCGKAGHIEDVVVDSSARGMQLGKKIVAAGSVLIEKKFVRSCGKAGHIEDVVVDSSARGMQLGKKVIG